MMYVRPVTAAEHTELKQMTRQAIGRVSPWAHMILLSAHRRSVPESALIVSGSRATVRFWIRQFAAAGSAGVYDTPRSGRPPTITAEVERTLVRVWGQNPQQVDASSLAPVWTTAMMVLVVASLHQRTVCRTTVRNALQRLAVRWRRPRLAMPRKTEPEKARKQWVIAEAVITAGEGDHPACGHL